MPYGMSYNTGPSGSVPDGPSDLLLANVGVPHGLASHHYSGGSIDSSAPPHNHHHHHHLGSSTPSIVTSGDQSYFQPGPAPPYCDTQPSTPGRGAGLPKRKRDLIDTDDPLVDWSAASCYDGPSGYDPSDSRSLFVPPNSSVGSKPIYTNDPYSYLDGTESWNGGVTGQNAASYHSFTSATPGSAGLPGTPQSGGPPPPYLHETSMYDSSSILSSLPPMSTFRGSGSNAPTTPSVTGYAGDNNTSSVLPPLPQATGDTLSKALTSIYSSTGTPGPEHASSTYSGSAGSTPVSSPPSWSRVATTTSFAPTTDSSTHLHPLVWIVIFLLK